MRSVESRPSFLLKIGIVVVSGILVYLSAYWWRELAVNNTTKESHNPINEPSPHISSVQTGNQLTKQSPRETEIIAVPVRRLIGYVKNVYADDQRKHLDFDDIQWLTGYDAAKARFEDGACGGKKIEDCYPCNEFYIRNQSTKTRTFEISDDAEITMATLSHTPEGNFKVERITFETFKSLFAESKPVSVIRAPYHIQLNDHLITKISEQYVP